MASTVAAASLPPSSTPSRHVLVDAPAFASLPASAPAALLPPRPEQRLSTLEAQIEEAERDGCSPWQIVEWRQKCLALVHLAFRNDMYQLARASTKLARAYLVIGCNELALSHARNAEAVLRGSKRVHTASPLLPEVLHALGLALSRSGKQGEATSYFKRALKACEQVHGPAHLQSCVILNAWSKMALDVSKDYALAHRLLQQEIEIRKAQGGDALSGKERDEVLSIVLQRARLILLQAKEIEKEGAKPDTPVEPRVRQLRQSAVELLRSEMVQMEGSGEQGEVNMGSEMEAQLVLHVADACRELGEWEQVKRSPPSPPPQSLRHSVTTCRHCLQRDFFTIFPLYHTLDGLVHEPLPATPFPILLLVAFRLRRRWRTLFPFWKNDTG